MKKAALRKHARNTSNYIARVHAGKGYAPATPAQPGSAGSCTADSTVNAASITQVASYPQRNSGNPGNN